jgi:predicted NBD/HSP70 family sugar kinase
VSYCCGIDLGGTKILGSLACDGTIVASGSRETHGDPGGVVTAIRYLIEELCQRAGLTPADIAVTAIGAAGVPRPDGGLVRAPNLGEEELSLTVVLAESLGHRVILENDVNAAAIGEMATTELQDFVFVAIGTGIGMGVISRGEILQGAHSAAGEIGYLPFGTDPLNIEHHHNGPLEEIVSGFGIEKQFHLASGRRLGAREIFDQAHDDPSGPASEVLDRAAFEAARAIVAVCAVLDPSTVVLGGGIGSREDFRARILKWLSALGHHEVDVRPSVLGVRATLIGALEIASRELEMNHQEGMLKR